MPLTTLAAVKLQDGITTTDWDAVISPIITSVDSRMRSALRLPIESEAKAEKHDGPPFPELLLRAGPIIGNPVVTESGASLTVAVDFEVDGIRLIRLSGGSPRSWVAGSRNVSVAYNAGYAAVPADIAQAALVQVRHEFHLAKNQHEMRLALGSSVLSAGGDTTYLFTGGELLPQVVQVLRARRAMVMV